MFTSFHTSVFHLTIPSEGIAIAKNIASMRSTVTGGHPSFLARSQRLGSDLKRSFGAQRAENLLRIIRKSVSASVEN
jgi:hypothetical protein